MLAAQIHRHVPGGRNVFGAGFGDQLQFGQTVVIGDAADDLGGGQIVFINRLRLSAESIETAVLKSIRVLLEKLIE